MSFDFVIIYCVKITFSKLFVNMNMLNIIIKVNAYG